MSINNFFLILTGTGLLLALNSVHAAGNVVVIPLESTRVESSPPSPQMISGSSSMVNDIQFNENEPSTFIGVGYNRQGETFEDVAIRMSVSGAVTDFNARWESEESAPGEDITFTWITNGDDRLTRNRDNIIRPPSLTCSLDGSDSCIDDRGCVVISAGDLATIRVSGGQPRIEDPFTGVLISEGDEGSARWSAVFTPGVDCSFVIVAQ